MAVRAPLELAISRQDARDIIASSIRNALASTVAGTLTSNIGEGMHPASGAPPRLDWLTHKVLHALTGAGTAGIAGDDMLSGAFGAVVGEIAGEIYRSTGMADLTPGTHAWHRAAETGANIAQMIATTAALALDLDADTAANAADTATRNNAFHPWALDQTRLRDLAPVGGGAGAGGFTTSTGRAGSIGMQSNVHVPGGQPLGRLSSPTSSSSSMPSSSSAPSTFDRSFMPGTGRLSSAPSTSSPAPKPGPSSSAQGKVHEFEVGCADALGKRSMHDGMEVHHVPQQHPALQVIPGYNPKTASSIVLTKKAHRAIPNRRGDYTGTVRDLLAQDLRNLREYTTTPNKEILEISKFAQQQHPEAYIRK